MDDLISEKEQIEQIRSWWSEYGGYVILGIAAGALLLFGFNYYQNSKEAAALEASTLYEKLANHVVDGDLDEAEAVADTLGIDFAKTVYSAQSKLAMARLYMDKNRDQDAADVLRELLDSDTGEELKQVARLRLARILLYQDKAQAVVDLLRDVDAPAFAAAYDEVLGDAYTALGEVAEAEAAYQRVLLDPLSQGTVDQQLVQWKVLDLPRVDTTEASTDGPAAQAPTGMPADEAPAALDAASGDEPSPTPEPETADEAVE